MDVDASRWCPPPTEEAGPAETHPDLSDMRVDDHSMSEVAIDPSDIQLDDHTMSEIDQGAVSGISVDDEDMQDRAVSEWKCKYNITCIFNVITRPLF